MPQRPLGYQGARQWHSLADFSRAPAKPAVQSRRRVPACSVYWEFPMSDHQSVCIITAASRGIGAAAAKLAARRGYAVAVNYFRDETAAGEVVHEIGAMGGR